MDVFTDIAKPEIILAALMRVASNVFPSVCAHAHTNTHSLHLRNHMKINTSLKIGGDNAIPIFEFA